MSLILLSQDAQPFKETNSLCAPLQPYADELLQSQPKYSKRALLPASSPATSSQQPQDQPPEPTTLTLIAADQRLVRFIHQDGLYQAQVGTDSPQGLAWSRNLPIVVEPGLLAALNETELNLATLHKLGQPLLHIGPHQEVPHQPGYVYIGQNPSLGRDGQQSHDLTLKAEAASNLGLAQQLATVLPQEPNSSTLSSVSASPKQANQPAIDTQQIPAQAPTPPALTLPSPTQQPQIATKGQSRFPASPVQATTPRLATSPTQPTTKQVMPSTNLQQPSSSTTTLQDQHALFREQQAAKAKRAVKPKKALTPSPVNPPKPSPSQAIIPISPTIPQAPSLPKQALQEVQSQSFLAQD